MGSDGEDDGSVDLDEEEASGDAMAEGEGDMDADSSGAEDMEDVEGDAARAGAADRSVTAAPAGVLSAAAGAENVQAVVGDKSSSVVSTAGQANCGAEGKPAANANANANANGGTVLC